MLTPLSRLLVLAEQTLKHPSWAIGHLDNVITRIRSQVMPHTGTPPTVEVCYALKWLFPENSALIEQILMRVPNPPPVTMPNRAAAPSLAKLCYALVILTQPASVVEIGVAEGMTSFYLLTALKSIGRGNLTSIDLPGLSLEWQTETGRAVPQELRPYWTLIRGPSYFKLPRVLKQLGAIDLAIHDGTHHAAGQIREYKLLWQHLRPGGILLSDDVENGAIAMFANAVGAPMFAVARQQSNSGLIGVMRKPCSAPRL